jgi:hypothetical protein
LSAIASFVRTDPDRARESGRNICLADDRNYGGWQEMVETESARPDGIEAVSIVTPNHMHFAPSRAFLEAGFHVISCAGNHCLDWGNDAFAETLAHLRAAGIDVIGAGEDIAAARRPAIRRLADGTTM